MGIEGSGHSVSVGIMQKGVPLGELFNNSGLPGSQILLHSIDQLLDQCRIEKENLQGICVTLGPGSFTSMRICLAVAEALGMGLQIPVYGIDELTLTANTVPFYPFPIKVIKSAYKGEFYTAGFSTSSGIAQRLDELHLVTPQTFLENLDPNELVLGNGLNQLLSGEVALEWKKARWNVSFSRKVGGINVIEYFLDTPAKEPSTIPLEPIYIRPSEAELNYERHFGISKKKISAQDSQKGPTPGT